MKALKKQLYILLALCGLALLFFVLLFVSDYRAQEAAAASGEIVFSCNPGLVTELQIVTEKESFAFVHDTGNDSWTFADTGEAANALRLAQMLAELREIRSDTVTGAVTDLAPYGLDTPSVKISFSYGDASHTLEIGNYSTAAHRYYARAEGENRVFLISTSVKTAFDVTEAELRAAE